MSRLYAAHPNQGERYYLRRLLLCRPGPTSFRDLCTLPQEEIEEHTVVDPTDHQTRFRLTCKQLGLLQDDQEWKLCIDDAHEIQSGMV